MHLKPHRVFLEVCTLFFVIGLIRCLWSLGFKMRGRKVFGNIKLGVLSSLGASYYPAVDITPTTLPHFHSTQLFFGMAYLVLDFVFIISDVVFGILGSAVDP